MLRKWIGGASLLAMAAVANAGTLEEDAKAFGTRPMVQMMTMSPSGSKLLSLASGPGRKTVLQIIDPATKAAKSIIVSAGAPESLEWCAFASDSRIVCEYGGNIPIDERIAGFSRLITVNLDGKDMRSLGRQSFSDFTRVSQTDGAVLDWLPDQPGFVLMARNYSAERSVAGSLAGSFREGIGVDRIDLATGHSSRVEAPNQLASGYITDGRGNIRFMTIDGTAGVDSDLSGRTTFKFRRAGSTKWEDFSVYDSVTGEGDYPIAVEGSSDTAFVLTKTNGRDALYRMSLDGTRTRTLIAAHPKVDILSVVRLGRGQKVVGYTFVDDRRRTVYFDDEMRKLAAGLGKALPQQPLIKLLSTTKDGSKILFFAYGDTDPGSFYVYDKASKGIDEISLAQPNLLDRSFSPMKAITYAAADGTQVPAYLTIPAGSSGKNLPAIVLPHGGPSARDEWRFDWLTQFLASRGYAVIQPNYRGSAGYGDEWMSENGFKGWRTSIGDVTAAAKYLVSEGIADPGKLAIVGWSYGGYAALQSAAVEPNLYKAAVAIAPVTDLSLLKRQANGFTSRRLVKDFVGSGPHVAEGSPLQHAADIKVPVLMFHGTLDTNVGIAHSEKMAAALTRAGKKAELVTFKDLEHQLDDSDARTQMLTRIGTFLEGAIGH